MTNIAICLGCGDSFSLDEGVIIPVHRNLHFEYEPPLCVGGNRPAILHWNVEDTIKRQNQNQNQYYYSQMVFSQDAKHD